jgi:hypothetical protein
MSISNYLYRSATQSKFHFPNSLPIARQIPTNPGRRIPARPACDAAGAVAALRRIRSVKMNDWNGYTVIAQSGTFIHKKLNEGNP